jgi:hypothetical protein
VLRRRTSEDGEGPWLANLDRVAQVKTALDVALSQVALIAPQEVVRLAASAGDAINKYVRDTANGTNLDAPLGFPSMRDALLIAMRADLGEPPDGQAGSERPELVEKRLMSGTGLAAPTELDT